MKGQIQFLDPFFKVFFTYRLFKSSAFLPFGTRNQGGKVLLTFFDTTGTACAEGNDGLSCKVETFTESIDAARLNPPPNWIP